MICAVCGRKCPQRGSRFLYHTPAGERGTCSKRCADRYAAGEGGVSPDPQVVEWARENIDREDLADIAATSTYPGHAAIAMAALEEGEA